MLFFLQTASCFLKGQTTCRRRRQQHIVHIIDQAKMSLQSWRGNSESKENTEWSIPGLDNAFHFINSTLAQKGCPKVQKRLFYLSQAPQSTAQDPQTATLWLSRKTHPTVPPVHLTQTKPLCQCTLFTTTRALHASVLRVFTIIFCFLSTGSIHTYHCYLE